MKLAIPLAVVVGCATRPATHPPTTPDALLAASASDFHAHPPPHVTALRNVRFGHLAKGNAIICGELRAIERPDTWITFATIQTSGYEQYVGNGAAQWCEGPIVWQREDLSAAMRARLDTH